MVLAGLLQSAASQVQLYSSWLFSPISAVSIGTTGPTQATILHQARLGLFMWKMRGPQESKWKCVSSSESTFRIDTSSLLFHPIGPSKSQILSRFKMQKNWLHLLIGEVTNLHCKEHEYKEGKNYRYL